MPTAGSPLSPSSRPTQAGTPFNPAGVVADAVDNKFGTYDYNQSGLAQAIRDWERARDEYYTQWAGLTAEAAARTGIPSDPESRTPAQPGATGAVPPFQSLEDWLANRGFGRPRLEAMGVDADALFDAAEGSLPGSGGGGGGISIPGLGGGGAGAGASDKEQRRNTSASWREFMRSWGIPINDNINALIKKATKNNWNDAVFIENLRRTPEYRQVFAGIFRDDGTLRMSEGEYLTLTRSYRQLAGHYGFKLDDQDRALLVRRDVSADELNQRLQSLRFVQDNQDAMSAFNQTLLDRGLIKKPLTKAEQVDFVYRRKDPQWTRIWEEASLRSAAEMSGVVVGGPGYSAITREQVLSIGSRGDFSSVQQNRQYFAELAQRLTTLGPESKLVSLGISRGEIIDLVFGGKRASLAAEKAERILKTYEGQYAEKANPQFSATNDGAQLLGASPRPQTA